MYRNYDFAGCAQVFIYVGLFVYIWLMSPVSSSPAPTGETFYRYLAAQKKMILVATAISVVCFVLLKYCFPVPDFNPDSTNYIDWAFRKFDVAFRPVGYSYFLRLLHAVTDSHLFFVFIQFVLFFLSTLYCFFSIDYLYGIPAKYRWPIFIAVVCNPVLIIQTNLITSDTIFCSLTVTWFAVCLWMLKKMNWQTFVAQILLLFICFEMRYTALFYPFVTIFIILISGAKKAYKLVTVLITVAVIFASIEWHKNENERVTGARVLSGFSGWQLANNALYCYKHVTIDTSELPSVQSKIINHFVEKYIDSVTIVDEVGFEFLWLPKSPLKKYMRIKQQFDRLPYLEEWYVSSISMNEYGWYIISHNPGPFMRYFIWPNFKRYLYPDPETIKNYYTSKVEIPQITVDWFKLKSAAITCRFPDLEKWIILPYPAICLLMEIFNVFAICVFAFRAFRVWRGIPLMVKGLFLSWTFYYFAFMAFSVFASAVNLRFLDPFFILGYIIPFILLKPGVLPAAQQKAK